MSCFHPVGDTDRFKAKGVSPYRIEELKKKIKQSLRNAQRLKLRQQLNKPIRVNPSFWEQVARDSKRELNQLELKKVSSKLKW